MNRCDIQILRIHVGYPAITIIMPCDKEKIKAKFRDVVDKLSSDDAIIASMEAHFEVMLTTLVCPLAQQSIALFINKYGARCYHLPFHMQELAVCDQTFKLDNIVARLNRLPRYWVLDCTAGMMKLYEGVEDFLIEVDKSHVVIDESGTLFVRKNHGSGLGDYFEQDRLPICLIGSADDIYTFTMDSPFRERVVAKVADVQKVWPAMQKYFEKRLRDTLKKLNTMDAGVEYVTELRAILKEARLGLVATLLFEDDYHLDACEENVTRQVTVGDEICPFGYQKISLIDQIIEAVCAKGGTLIVVPAGALQEYGRMVAIVRD